MDQAARVGEGLRDHHILAVCRDRLNGRIQDVVERMDLGRDLGNRESMRLLHRSATRVPPIGLLLSARMSMRRPQSQLIRTVPNDTPGHESEAGVEQRNSKSLIFHQTVNLG